MQDFAETLNNKLAELLEAKKKELAKKIAALTNTEEGSAGDDCLDEAMYRVWGEYGVHASDFVEIKVKAKDEDDALSKGTAKLKKDRHWSKIGSHNVYVELISEENSGNDECDDDCECEECQGEEEE